MTLTFACSYLMLTEMREVGYSGCCMSATERQTKSILLVGMSSWLLTKDIGDQLGLQGIDFSAESSGIPLNQKMFSNSDSEKEIAKFNNNSKTLSVRSYRWIAERMDQEKVICITIKLISLKTKKIFFFSDRNTFSKKVLIMIFTSNGLTLTELTYLIFKPVKVWIGRDKFEVCSELAFMWTQLFTQCVYKKKY